MVTREYVAQRARVLALIAAIAAVNRLDIRTPLLIWLERRDFNSRPPVLQSGGRRRLGKTIVDKTLEPNIV